VKNVDKHTLEGAAKLAAQKEGAPLPLFFCLPIKSIKFII
jgi:hypothetical protein